MSDISTGSVPGAPPQAQSPITKLVDAQRGVIISDESLVSKTVVKAAVGTAAASQLGIAYGSSTRQGDALVLGSRPDEWMVLFEAPESVEARIAGEGFVSFIDWTHSRGMLRVTGTDAARTLEKVCNIDFSDAMMPNGAVLSVGVASVGTDMVRDDMDGVRSYLMLFDRSFGQSLYDALIDAAAEFRSAQ